MDHEEALEHHPVDAAAVLDRPWVAIQRNPRSGSGSQRRPLLDLIRSLRQRGLRPCVFRDRGMLRRWLDDPRRRTSLVCLVAAGGDGTVADLINRCPGIPVAILPTGTENLLSRYLKVPSSGQLVGTMIAGGRRRILDLGLAEAADPAGGTLVRRFSVLASVGFDAEVIRLAHAARTGHISRLGYVRHILSAIGRYRHPRLKVWIDDEPAPRSAGLVVVMNLSAYALGLPVARNACGDDGLLDIRLFDRSSAWAMIRYFTAAACGWHERLPDVHGCRARRIRIESDIPAPLQCDGDPAGVTPVTLHILPGAVELYTPGDHVAACQTRR